MPWLAYPAVRRSLHEWCFLFDWRKGLLNASEALRGATFENTAPELQVTTLVITRIFWMIVASQATRPYKQYRCLKTEA